MGLFRNILVHADGRHECRHLIDCAVELARHNQAKLKLVDIMPRKAWPARLSIDDIDDYLNRLATAKEKRLRKLADEFQSESLEISYRVLQSPTSLAIIREAVQSAHDLVIKGVKGPESRLQGFFGTTAKRLLRQCPAPVLLVKPEFSGPFERIVAAVDVTSEHETDICLNAEIVQMAQNLSPVSRRLHLLHAWSLYGASVLRDHMREDELADAVTKTEQHARHCMDALIQEQGLDAKQTIAHLVQGDPINVIPDFVTEQNPDLLVMGTVGRTGVAGMLMGNTAEQILEHVACSVLAVKPPGFKTTLHTDE